MCFYTVNPENQSDARALTHKVSNLNYFGSAVRVCPLLSRLWCPMKFLPRNCVVSECACGRCSSFVIQTHCCYSCFYHVQYNRFGLEGHCCWKEVMKPDESEVLEVLFSYNVDSIQKRTEKWCLELRVNVVTILTCPMQGLESSTLTSASW